MSTGIAHPRTFIIGDGMGWTERVMDVCSLEGPSCPVDWAERKWGGADKVGRLGIIFCGFSLPTICYCFS